MEYQTTTAPTPMELASLKLEDELGLALDNIKGTAYLLGNHADGCACDGERHALNALASVLYESAERVESARAAVVALRASASSGEGVAA